MYIPIYFQRDLLSMYLLSARSTFKIYIIYIYITVIYIHINIYIQKDRRPYMGPGLGPGPWPRGLRISIIYDFYIAFALF